MTPQLSIITPVFNSIGFIEKCLNNVIDQNAGDSVEHIIVDGGSTDGTLDVIRHFAQKHAHIRYISEPDKGQSDAMNKGINLARGEIISFLNVDDGYYPFILRRVIDIFKRNKNINFIAGNCKVFSIEGDLIYYNRPKRVRDYHLFSYLEAFPVNPSAYFYKKQLHEITGFYNEENHYTMDYDFILRVSQVINIIYFNEDFGYAIYHQDSKTKQDLEKNQMFEKKRKTFELNYQMAKKPLKVKAKLYFLVKKLRLKS